MWRKLGRIFDPAQRAWWMRSHAANPVAMPLGGNRYRIYCTGRDDLGRSHVGWFEIDMTAPDRVLRISEEPFLTIGPLGAYDDSGVLNACYVDLGDRQYHYFSGLTLAQRVPFHFFASVAVSYDGGLSAEKISPSPMLERDAIDPFLTGSPCVLLDEGRWRMWYTSGVRWELHDGAPRHYYHIKYAESDDGLHWRRDGRVAVDFADAEEHVVARPCVRKDGDLYRMWFSHRGDAYRLGYAESRDGLRWERRHDASGMTPSADGWDSEMLCYAFVFDHGGSRYMLYNGNGYGRTGIGLAEFA